MAKFVNGASHLIRATGRRSNNTSIVQDSTSASEPQSQSNGARNMSSVEFSEELDDDFVSNLLRVGRILSCDSCQY